MMRVEVVLIPVPMVSAMVTPSARLKSPVNDPDPFSGGATGPPAGQAGSSGLKPEASWSRPFMPAFLHLGGDSSAPPGVGIGVVLTG